MSLDKVTFCPVCMNKVLILRQINFTTAVYLCEDPNCIYPEGHSWIEVHRKLEDMCKETEETTVNNYNTSDNLDNWLNEVFDISVNGVSNKGRINDEVYSSIIPNNFQLSIHTSEINTSKCIGNIERKVGGTLETDTRVVNSLNICCNDEILDINSIPVIIDEEHVTGTELPPNYCSFGETAAGDIQNLNENVKVTDFDINSFSLINVEDNISCYSIVNCNSKLAENTSALNKKNRCGTFCDKTPQGNTSHKTSSENDKILVPKLLNLKSKKDVFSFLDTLPNQKRTTLKRNKNCINTKISSNKFKGFTFTSKVINIGHDKI